MASQNFIKSSMKSAVLSVLLFSLDVFALTCPGFPGYCSESFPGQTCVVVCSKGRNNVPLCQEDGTWTDIPRCIEHDPGVPNQIPGVCPGISGYCSDGFVGSRCNFACSAGPAINSLCSQDGTWTPYPTCPGDLRENQDGCVSCPGPNGRPRNRTAEAILGVTLHNPVPNSNSAPRTDSQAQRQPPPQPQTPVFREQPQPQAQPPVFREQPQPQAQPPVFREQPQPQAQPPVFREQPQPQSQPPIFREQPQPQAQPPVFREQPQPQAQPPIFREQPQPQAQPPVFREQPQQQQQFGPPPPGRQPTGFSAEQQRIIQQFSARVEGAFPGQQGQPQLQEPRQLPPPNFPAFQEPLPLGTPTPRGPRPDIAFPRPDQDRFGPFEVVQPPEENSVDTGPLASFPAIPIGSPAEFQKARERPGAFGPFQLIDL